MTAEVSSEKYAGLAREFLRLDQREKGVMSLSLQIAIGYFAKWLDARGADETTAEWRCFHCDEVFTDREKAAEHFGKYEMREPACTIDIAEYRRMEEVNRGHCAEDTELYRTICRMAADHAVALRREEETGYARGLRDAGFSEKTSGESDAWTSPP